MIGLAVWSPSGSSQRSIAFGIALLLPCMGAAAELNYSGPNEKNAPLEQFYFTQWKKGDEPFVAAADANLRRQASVSSEVVAQLSLGSKVKVLSGASLAPEPVLANAFLGELRSQPTGPSGSERCPVRAESVS